MDKIIIERYRRMREEKARNYRQGDTIYFFDTLVLPSPNPTVDTVQDH